MLFPKLSELLKPSKITQDKFYFYRLDKKGKWVSRMAKIDVIEKPFGNEKFEKFIHDSHDLRIYKQLIHEIPSQTKLLEVTK